MYEYPEPAQAIVDLHERGYCQDFALSGNDLLWLQEKVLVLSGDFAIVEHYRFSCGYRPVAMR
jgi:hypothetical protein